MNSSTSRNPAKILNVADKIFFIIAKFYLIFDESHPASILAKPGSGLT